MDPEPQRVTIAKTFDFDAAHFLPKVAATHKCRRMHGHTYRVELLFTGDVQIMGDEEGMVIDYGKIAVAWDPIHALLDHRTLNEIPGLENPTTEVLAPFILRMIRDLAHLPITQVKVYESATTWCSVHSSMVASQPGLGFKARAQGAPGKPTPRTSITTAWLEKIAEEADKMDLPDGVAGSPKTRRDPEEIRRTLRQQQADAVPVWIRFADGVAPTSDRLLVYPRFTDDMNITPIIMAVEMDLPGDARGIQARAYFCNPKGPRGRLLTESFTMVDNADKEIGEGGYREP